MIILPSLEIVPAKYNGSTLLSQIPVNGTGDFTVIRATTPTAGQSTRVNALGQIELVADNVPRLDYLQPDGTIGCPALLVEPAATNSIRNNSMVGASVSGNTLPTNYSTSLAGLTRTIVGTGTENGVAYMDIRFSGTSVGGAVVISEETSTSITAASGQVWTHSVYAKLIANVSNMPSIRVGMYEYTSGGVYLAEGSTPFTLTSSLNRFSFTRTLANSSTARVTPIVQWFVNNGVSYDFTVRIGYPQMETGSVATSVIPTTTQAITRAADVVTNTVASGLIGQTEGTLYAEFSVDFNNRNADILNVNDGSSSNGFFMGIRNSSVVQLIVRRAASNALIFQRTGTYPTGVNKLAVAYKNGDFAICLNGTTAQIDTTSITMPSVSINRVSLGQNSLYTLDQQLRIRSATLYQTRLTNTQLALLTSPYTSYSSMASALSYTLG